MNTQNRALKGNFSNTVLISIKHLQTQLRVCGGGAEDYWQIFNHVIKRIFHCCCQSCLIHAIPNDFRFRCLQNDNRSVFIRHKRHWLCIADIAVSQTSRDHMRARYPQLSGVV